MSAWIEGRVASNRHWTDALFSLRVEAEAPAFEAGQFVKLALDLHGERVARPFSFVNPPFEGVSEFFGVVVPDGPLSPRLARLAAGDRVLLSGNPSGFLVLSEVPPAQTLWMLATGTGIAPFLSILRDRPVWHRYTSVVLVQAVRWHRELVYGDLVAATAAARPGRLRHVRVVSREPAQGGLEGRIPAAIRDGRLEGAAQCALDVHNSQVMICGNPDMLRDSIAALSERGFRKHRRRSPGQITTEAFW